MNHIANQAASILVCLAGGIDPEGNSEQLLAAMGEAGHCNPNNAYQFERSPCGQFLEVINETEGWTLLVSPITGEVTSPPEDEVATPGPAVVAEPDPAEYYRVLVNKRGEKWFRPPGSGRRAQR